MIQSFTKSEYESNGRDLHGIYHTTHSEVTGFGLHL